MNGTIAVLLHDGFYGCGTGAGTANRALLQALARHHGHLDWRVLPVRLCPHSPEFDVGWHDQTCQLLAQVTGHVVVDPVDNGTGAMTRFGGLDCFRKASTHAAQRLNSLGTPHRPGLIIAVDTPFHGVGEGLDADLAARTLVLPRSTARLHAPHDRDRALWEQSGWASVLARGGHVGAISAHMRSHLESSYGLAPEEIVDMPDGLITGAHHTTPAPPLPVPAQDGFVLSLGRATPYKGFEDLIEAWALLQADGEHLPHLLVAAVTETSETTPYQRHLAQHIAQRNVKATLWTRFDPGIRSLFTHSGARAVVVPSRVEPFGLVPLEVFAASGPPVVATATGGLVETVREPQSGFTAAPADPASLAQAIRRALRLNPHERERLRARTVRLSHEHDYARAVRAVVQRLAPWAVRP